MKKPMSPAAKLFQEAFSEATREAVVRAELAGVTPVGLVEGQVELDLGDSVVLDLETISDAELEMLGLDRQGRPVEEESTPVIDEEFEFSGRTRR